MDCAKSPARQGGLMQGDFPTVIGLGKTQSANGVFHSLPAVNAAHWDKIG
jgi:hypothetical protein